MQNKLVFFLFLLSILFIACNSNGMKTYQVKKTSQAILLTGKGSDPAWDKATKMSDFSYPWRDETAPKTTFQALWDDDFFYFLYRATDADVFLKQEGLGEKDVVDSDRVEIFFKADDQMNPYYALEMDALGRVLDTEGKFYRDVDFNWNWPKGELLLKASIDETGYWVEGAISFKSLRALGMYKDDYMLKAGLYRGEYQEINGKQEVKWISWVKPDSETPDFHIPSSFGRLELLK